MPASRRPRARRERQLVKALHAGDGQGIELMLGLYGPLLRGYLGELLNDEDAVQDVLQQTLLDAWRRGQGYDPNRASPATWLLVIARSRALDHLRRRVPEPVDPDSLATLADDNAEQETAALLEHWRLAAMIATLPRQEARLLAMRFDEGLSQREIAERTGLPLGTVKMRMVQALRRLRAAIDADEAR